MFGQVLCVVFDLVPEKIVYISFKNPFAKLVPILTLYFSDQDM